MNTKRKANRSKIAPKKAEKPAREKCVGKVCGRQCRNYAAPGSDKCKRRHNGGAQKGADASNYQGKGWSKYLPPKLIERANEAFNYTELYSLKEEIVFFEISVGCFIRTIGICRQSFI